MNKDNKKTSRTAVAALLCTALLFLCLVLFVSQFVRYLEVKSAVESARYASVTESPLPEAREIKTTLSASSTEEDLYIVVKTESGHAIENESLAVSVIFPNGNVFAYSTEPDGSLYLEGLSRGEYTVSMESQGVYLAPDDVTVQVNKRRWSAASADGNYIVDENGNIVYSYRFSTDENGYLLYRSNGKPSDVLLVGSPQSGNQYGLRFISPDDFLSDESTALHVERIELIYPDNTINDLYDIEAVPIERGTQTGGWQLTDGGICYIGADGRRLKGFQRINGKKFFFDDNGIKATAIGVDVSSYNNSINWEAVKASGVDFCILRVGGRGWTSGLTYDDSFFYSYLQGARKAGIKLGLYFYSTAVTPEEAVEEANFTLKRLAHAPLDMPIYFDSEYSGEYPDGRADLLSISQRTTLARIFCETIETAGYSAGVYASQNFFGTTLDYLPVSQYSIWLANYTRDQSLPSFFYDYDMWQFTESGTISGFSGKVDINVIF